MKYVLQQLRFAMEQWNNVELTTLSKKSYTLNHKYDIKNNKVNDNNNSQVNGNHEPATASAAANIEISPTDDVLQPGSNIKPKVTLDDVECLLRRLYGITTSDIKELIAYDDRNYYIKEDRNIKNPLIVTHCPHGYVFKILNALDSKKTDFVEAQNELLLHLSKRQIQCPRPIANACGKYYSVECINGTKHVVRLLEFIPGKIFHQVEKSNYILYQCGEYLAQINRALKFFSHAAYETHKTLWMLQSVPKLRDFVYVLQDHSRKAIVEEIIESFEKTVLGKLDEFEKQIIHGDFNEQNIIVNAKPNYDEYEVVGVIDFGDTTLSPLIFEVGIAMTYMMLQAKTLESGGIFLAGYNAVLPIKENEKSYLKYCVAARLAQSLTMGSYSHSLDPSNDYVLTTQSEGWRLIEELWRENFDNIDTIWESAGSKYLAQSNK